MSMSSHAHVHMRARVHVHVHTCARACVCMNALRFSPPIARRQVRLAQQYKEIERALKRGK